MEVEPLTMETVLDSAGPRVPAYGEAPTESRLATVVLSWPGLLAPHELAWFDAMSARGEAREELPFLFNNIRTTTAPFYVATGGRGTLVTALGELDPEVAAPPTSRSRRRL